MPTKTTPEERIASAYLTMLVGDTAMHILHESAFYGSDLWPVSGFRPNCYGKPLVDCISYGVNPYGWEKKPIIGRLGFTVWNYQQSRVNEQFEQIKLLFDYTYYNDILFENELRRSYITDMLWFKFTYTPKAE
ncbi:hypothetical protein [Mucilaginibacter lappiensis]|uniref:Uncharacterized protein n=1 Tax=Mucilaginibacter lappiensis TaxID=354630 RepID=A0A841JKU3_9SPHI|nr:hypothetical protein [Mucilaginibacter lappiensis]MBB6131799.1 hypothetical protein [Mucilaginibacter lappiensis]